MGTSRKDPQYIIYALHHPNSKRVYVGKSSKGMRRPRAHSEPGHLKAYAHLPRAKWIQSLKKRGLEPKIAILEICERVEDLDEAEKFYIACFRAIDVPLLNLTDGGDGINGYRHSDKARAQMSEKRRKLASTEAGHRQMVVISNGYWRTEEAREKKRQERLGSVQLEETKAKIAKAITGKKKTPEEIANMRTAAKARWAVPGYREKQIEAQRQAQSRPDTRAKKADAAAKQWDPEARAKKSEEVSAYFENRANREKHSKVMTGVKRRKQDDPT